MNATQAMDQMRARLRALPPVGVPRLMGAVLLVEILLLRLWSYGRYAALIQSEDWRVLIHLHSLSKVLIVGALAVWAFGLLRGSLHRPALTAPVLQRRVLLGHGAAMGVLFAILPFLPRGMLDSGALPVGLALRYGIAILCLSAGVLTAAALFCPRSVLDGLRRPWVGLVGILTLLALWVTLSPLVVDMLFLRKLVEGTTLHLSQWFYGLSGGSAAVTRLDNGTPLMTSPGFSISIAPSCSGYQGMAGAFVLLAAYIAMERRSLRLGRAIGLAVGAVAFTFVLNGARIAMLFYIGAEISPEVAVNGFHSNFGTLSLFAVSALAMLVMEQAFMRRTGGMRLPPLRLPQDALARIAIVMAPQAIYLLSAIVAGLFVGSFNWLYPVPVLIGFAALWVLRDHLRPVLSHAPGPLGLIGGAVAFGVWMWMIPPDPDRAAELVAALGAAPVWLAGVWLVFRVVGTSILIPVIEELAFRAGVQRLIADSLPDAMMPVLRAGLAVGGAAVAFGLLHSTILAAIVVGGIYGLLALRPGGLVDAVLAHAVTNFLIVLAVLGFDMWSYW